MQVKNDTTWIEKSSGKKVVVLLNDTKIVSSQSSTYVDGVTIQSEDGRYSVLSTEDFLSEYEELK